MCANSSAELEGWLEALDKGSKHNPVSGPITVSHKVHVNFDSETGFSGLPAEWNDILQAHGITPQAYSSPQEAEREVETLMKVKRMARKEKRKIDVSCFFLFLGF
jgi:hypothetical protein